MLRIVGPCMLSASLCGATVTDQLPGGHDDALPGVVLGARADEPCPSNAITGQAPGACGSTRWFFYSDLEFCYGTQCRRVRCDDFPPSGNLDPNDPNNWIGAITWYGVYITDSQAGCTKTGGHQFRIRFYEPDPNDPNKVLRDPNGVPVYDYEEYLVALADDTGETVDFGSGPAIRWHWTAVLTTSRQMARGWFSIVGAGTPACYALWEGSNAGNNRFANWYEQPFGSFEYRTTFCDLDWCLFGGPRGACCHELTGQCDDDVPEQACEGYWDQFFPNQTCGQIWSQCAGLVGACCHPDGSCEETTYAQCMADSECDGDFDCDGDVDFDDIPHVVYVLQGGWPCSFENGDCNDDGFIDFADINCFVEALGTVCPPLSDNEWLGPYVHCDPNSNPCCQVAPGTPAEGEPPCGNGYVDTFNGGCDSSPPVFSTITPGVTMYGKSGTFNTGWEARRDTDWYEFATASPAVLGATVEAEFSVELLIYGAGDCDPNSPNAYWSAASASGLKCTPVTATTVCVPAGTYWVVIRPQSLTGLPCGVDYKLTLLEPTACTPCEITCTPTQTEAEACDQNYPVGTNGGCYDDPNHPFEPLGPFVSNVPYTLCGTLWATNGLRDTDWYSFTLPTMGTLAWEYEAEIPLITTPVFAAGFNPPYCDGQMWGYWGVQPITPCVPPNNVVSVAPADVLHGNTTYWWVVFPDDGDPLFEGYPCLLGQSDYRVTITYTPPFSDDVCVGVLIHENEPPCGPGYVDTFNGGCDAPAFVTQAAIPFGESHCGKSGLWTEGETQHADYDWWKIQLTGTTNKRLRINFRAAFDVGYELYRINDPNAPCASLERLDYYEFMPFAPALDIYTPCLQPSSTKYYALRIFPRALCTCTELNKYRFSVTVASETPACALCAVTCSTGPDDDCQDDPTDPDTNEGCDTVWQNEFMTFQAGNNTYGPKYCGRLSTFADPNAEPTADVDWFQVAMPTARTKLLIRAKAEYRLSVNLMLNCADPGTAHGWDRACKGTTTPWVNTWTALTPGTTYLGTIIYGNGGGDGTGEEPLRQFFSGLPCSDGRNEYEVELMVQT